MRPGEETIDEAPALRRRLRELEATIEHLADANIRAAELVAELKEARAVEEALRRRAEEMELQQRVERTLATSRSLPVLAAAVTAALVECKGLECPGAAFYLCERGAPRLLGHAGALPDAEVECRDVGVTLRAEGGALLSLLIGERPLGLLVLDGPWRTEWRERWSPALRTFGLQLGNAIDRIQVEEHNRQLIRDLAEARDRALEATRAKDRFLATMSHELRTPLNAIIGYGELLQEDAEESGDDAAVADLRRITSSGRHLLALISDVLDLAKIEAGKIEIEREPFAVAEVVTEVAEMIQPLIERNHNALRIELDEALGAMTSDAGKLRQVLLNLLGNASKFTRDGVVTLSARACPGGARLLFEVEDTGIGMSEAELARVFEPFVQADASTTRRYGGTGLGLTISGSYVALMGGSMTVRSAPGVGTAFTLDLPREAPAPGLGHDA
ncbi:MAG: hypothetical protein H6711_14540 [Myxococcales bacterium]|nr:hypothetical protein [Myxococcales bacterium]